MSFPFAAVQRVVLRIHQERERDLECIFDLVRVQGTVVIFGMPHGDPVFPFNWATMYSKLPNIIVTNSARAGEVYPAVVTMVDLIAKGRLDLSYMISHHVPFNDVSRAYEMFSNRTDNSM